MTSLQKQGITINILADPGEQCLIVGDAAGYDEVRDAINLAMQSKTTHPGELYRINHYRDKWHVVRCVK